MRSYYQRNYYTSAARHHSKLSLLKPVLIAAGVVVVVILLIRLVVSWGSDEMKTPAANFKVARGSGQIQLNNGVKVNVLAGKEEMVFVGEEIETRGGSYAVLKLLDGSEIRLNENTVLQVKQMSTKDGVAKATTELKQGEVWIKADLAAKGLFVIQALRTKTRIKGTEIDITSDEKVDSIRMIKGEVELDVLENVGGRILRTLTLGVGQQVVITEETKKSIAAGEAGVLLQEIEDAFKKTDWYRWNSNQEEGSQTAETIPEGEIGTENLVKIVAPQQGYVTKMPSVNFSGTYSKEQITKITLNQELVVMQEGTWELKNVPLTVDGENKFMVLGLDQNNQYIFRRNWVVRRSSELPPAPIITSPIGNPAIITGERIDLEGTVAESIVKVEVNDYALKKFVAGSGKWKYIALVGSNIEYGKSTFLVHAYDKYGNKSLPAKLDVYIKKPGETVPTGVLSQVDKGSLPTPIILEPNEGKDYSTANPAVIITGMTDPRTQKLQVNEFVLKKFKPGDTAWLYYAYVEYSTLKEGENIYKVYAVDAAGKKSEPAVIKITYQRVAASEETPNSNSNLNLNLNDNTAPAAGE